MNEKSCTSRLLIERQRRCQSVDPGLFKISGTFAHRLKTFAISILPIGFTLTLNAGTLSVLQSSSTSTAVTNTLTIRTEGSRCRIELSPILTLLLDGDTGYGFELLHPGKAYIRKSLAELAATSSCQDEAKALTPKPTGQSKTVSGHLAREYKVTGACGDRLVWIAPDFPDWQKLRDETALARAKLPAFARFNLADSPLPGMIVSTVSLTTNQASKAVGKLLETTVITNKTTLLSSAIVPEDSEAFQIPEDYREVNSFESSLEMQTNEFSAALVENANAELITSPGIESLALQMESQIGLRQHSGLSDNSASTSPTAKSSVTKSPTVRVVAWDNSIGKPIETIISVSDNAFSPITNVVESSKPNNQGVGRVNGTISKFGPMTTSVPSNQLPAAVLNRSSK